MPSMFSPRFWILQALVLVAACSPNAPGGACTTTAECSVGATCMDGRCVARTDAAGDDGGPDATPGAVTYRVEPESVTLESIDGSMPTQAFALIQIDADGTETTLAADDWILNTGRIGEVSGGVFTANGIAGGVDIVRPVAVGVSGRATAEVRVNVHRTELGAGVETTAPSLFAGAPVADPSAITPLYPLEGAIMPRNVFPPTVQWAPVGAAGDLFRVRMSTTTATIEAILLFADGFAHGWPLTRELWRSIADSEGAEDVTISVDRYEAATGRVIGAAAPRTIHLARGNIFGSVYYEHRTGTANIIELDTETATIRDLITYPYPDSGGTACVGCHALSHDGRYLFGTNAQTMSVYDVTADLSTNPPPTRFPLSGGAVVASFDPTGAYFVGGSHVAGPLGIFDANTGVPVDGAVLPAHNPAGYPSWSADGARIVYSGDVVTAPAGHPEAGNPIGGDLHLIDRVGDALEFMAPRVLHAGASLAGMPEGGVDDTHAAWSPDSRYVAFQHGPGTFTHVVRNPGGLYLVDLEGNTRRLDNASAGTDGYWPTFAPYITDEGEGKRYLWMAFYARRDYGNAALGTQGTANRQLWVSAIDPDAAGDPSFVPYWLPGQSTATSNFSAFWAPTACRSTGDDCGSASECCSGLCGESETGEFACLPPPPDACRFAGEGCGGDGECCAGLMCNANRCQSELG